MEVWKWNFNFLSTADLTAEAADGETKGDDSEKTESPEQNAENTPAPDSVQETQEGELKDQSTRGPIQNKYVTSTGNSNVEIRCF